MRTVQQTFDLMISLNYYSVKRYHCKHMCISLVRAHEDNHITRRELKQALSEIQSYIGQHGTLTAYFDKVMRRDITMEEKLELYQNWSNRPQPPKEQDDEDNTASI